MTAEPTVSNSSDANTPSGPPKSALLIVFVVVFIDLLGFGIVLPLLPRYADDYLTRVPNAVGGAIIGILYTSFSLMQLIFAPIWGRLSDRFGRRPILLIGLAGSVVFYTLFAFATDLSPAQAWLALSLILLSRVGAGISGATIGTAQAVIADCTPPEQRARGMALIGAAFGIGFTFGPLVAYAALTWYPDSRAGVGLVAAGLSLIALVLAVILLPETRQTDAPAGHRGRPGFRKLLSTLQTPTVGLLVAIATLGTFAFANFEATLALLTESFGYADADNFLVFAYVGFVLMMAQGVYRGLIRRSSEVTFVRLGVFLMFAGIVGLAVVAALTDGSLSNDTYLLGGFRVALTVAVCGFAFTTPSVQGLISRRSDPNRQGEVLGVNQAFNALARIGGPMVGLTLFPLENTAHVLPYVVAGSVLLFVLTLVPRVQHDPVAEPLKETNDAPSESG